MKYLKHLPIVLLTAFFASPIVVLFIAFFLPDDGVFLDLLVNDVPAYAVNTALLLGGVLLVAGFFGTYAAWCISRYHFPFRRLLDIALMLPLAMPSYISAMVYGRLLDEAGPIQAMIGGQFVPPIYSLGGLVFVLSWALFPYVYMAMRIAFSLDMRRLIEPAQMLGVKESRLLWRVAVPASLPALIGGLSLVAMETLAEFGASSLYGVQTFTTGIYHAWYQQFSSIAAAQLSMLLVVVIFLALWLEKRLRRNARYHRGEGLSLGDDCEREQVPFYRIALCAAPALFGFVIPLGQLLYWASLSAGGMFDTLTLEALNVSLSVALYVAVFAVIIALTYAYLGRKYPKQWFANIAIRIATLGYAIPGTVIAVALFIPLFAMDRAVYNFMQDDAFRLLFTGSLFAMVVACVVRFLAVAYQLIQPALLAIPARHDEAAKMLGAGSGRIVRSVHLPLLKPALLMGAMVVMVDTLRELPASLMLRPFDQSTLAIRAYELAVDGRLIAASHSALWVVGVSAIAVVVLHSVNHYAAKRG